MVEERKVITADKVVNDLTTVSTEKPLSANQGKVLKDLVDSKQSTLTFDETPTSGSNNPVKSNGIYNAVINKQDKITSTNKLLSDLVNTTSQTNQFVTNTEKTSWNSKQEALVSGTNIKTINGLNLLGSGDITIGGSANWGSIGGTLSNQTDLWSELNDKVTKIAGMGLSTNDYSDVEKNKLDGIEDNAQRNAIETIKVNGTEQTITARVVNITVDKTTVGLSNVNNTSDADKPVSTATQTVLNNKVDKETGKGLSTNDYTDSDVTKLSNIQPGAEVNVQSDWNQVDTTSDSFIKNKPSTMAPTSHASSHANGGSDAISIDASQITSGVLAAARVPSSAFQKLVVVANQAARFALTTADVSLGDSVKQNDTGLMYIVKDTTQLSSEAGYEVYTAVTSWNAITGKPDMPKSATATLLSTGWNASKQQTVSVTGMTATCSVIVSPSPASYDEYYDKEIRCISQAAGTLTFEYKNAPTSDLTVNIVMVYT